MFLVNPINDKIEVFKVYKSLFDIFKSFDLVVTAVGSKNALDYEKLKK
jgi:predicted CoA-binding protein